MKSSVWPRTTVEYGYRRSSDERTSGPSYKKDDDNKEGEPNANLSGSFLNIHQPISYVNEAFLENFSEAVAGTIAVYNADELQDKLVCGSGRELVDDQGLVYREKKKPIAGVRFIWLFTIWRLPPDCRRMVKMKKVCHIFMKVAFCPPRTETRIADLRTLFFTKDRAYRELGHWDYAICEL